MSVIKNSLIFGVGDILSKSIPFLLLPYLTRKIGTEDYGELVYYQAFIALGLIFIGLSQAGAITRYAFRYGRKSLGVVVTSGHLLSFVLTFLIIIFSSLFTSNAEIIIYIVIISLTNELLAVQLALRQYEKKAKEYVIINITNGLLSALVTVLIFEFLSPSPEHRLISIIVANSIVVTASLLFYSNMNKVRYRITPARLKLGTCYVIGFGMPLILHQLSILGKGQLDRLVIYNLYSPKDLGIYAAAFQIATILNVFIAAANKALTPFYFERIKNKTINFNWTKKYSFYAMIFVPLPALVSLVIPDYIYTLFLGEGFVGVGYFVTSFLLGIAALIPYMIMVNFFFYHGKGGVISLTTGFSLLFYFIYIYIASKYSINYLPFGLLISNLMPVFILSFVGDRWVKYE